MLSFRGIAALLLVRREDTINGYFVKRKALLGTDFDDTTFYPDDYLVKITRAESNWQYDQSLALEKTWDYFLLVMERNYTMVVEKAAPEGTRSGTMEVITCLPKAEPLQERHYLFLQINRNRAKSCQQVRVEIAEMKWRLQWSWQYIGQPKEQLEVEFSGENDL